MKKSILLILLFPLLLACNKEVSRPLGGKTQYNINVSKTPLSLFYCRIPRQIQLDHPLKLTIEYGHYNYYKNGEFIPDEKKGIYEDLYDDFHLTIGFDTGYFQSFFIPDFKTKGEVTTNENEEIFYKLSLTITFNPALANLAENEKTLFFITLSPSIGPDEMYIESHLFKSDAIGYIRNNNSLVPNPEANIIY
jgi:hypothetical protein